MFHPFHNLLHLSLNIRVIFQAICFMLNIHLIYISISPLFFSLLKENFLLDINWLVPLKHTTDPVELSFNEWIIEAWNFYRNWQLVASNFSIIIRAIFENFSIFIFKLAEGWRNSCSHFHSRLVHTWLQSWRFSLILLSSLETLNFWVMQVRKAEMFIIILQIFSPVCCSSRELAG